MEIKVGQNTGVRIDPIRPTDFTVAGESAAVRTVLSENGQYDFKLPTDETQKRFGFDAMACVSFSALNNLEIIFNTLITLGLISADGLKFLRDEGYIDQTGQVNFSDRFTAKMSGTTKNGNSLPAVGDSIRKLHGLVPEKDWAWPSEISSVNTDEANWNIFYQDVPQAVIDKGLRFLKKFSIQYEWVVLAGATPDARAAIKSVLKYGPVQIAAAVCWPWNTDQVINACGCGTQHATTIVGFKESGEWKDYDHYFPYLKTLAADYCLPYAMQYHVSEIQAPAPVAFKYVFNKNLKYGDSNSEVVMLQKALQSIVSTTGKPYMTIGLFGPYGPATKTSVKQFQVDNGIVDDDGSHFGPLTRAAMNKKLNQ